MLVAIIGSIVAQDVMGRPEIDPAFAWPPITDAVTAMAVILSFPLFVSMSIWILVFVFVRLSGEEKREHADLSWTTFKHIVAFAYVHFPGRFLIMLGRVELANKVYQLAGAHCYRDDGFVTVTCCLPDENNTS